MEIMKASAQWANRPADERFWNLQDLLTATRAHHAAANTATLKLSDMRVEVVDGDLQLMGKTGIPAQITHFAFGQLSARAEAPASYLRTLPATLAAQNINYGLKARAAAEPNTEAKLLLHKNGGFYARAITSDKYTRIWNDHIVERLLKLESDGWKVPPAYYTAGNGFSGMIGRGQSQDMQALLAADKVRYATAEQAKLSLSIREGDLIGPAGLYASFEDMFAFMIHPERVI